MNVMQVMPKIGLFDLRVGVLQDRIKNVLLMNEDSENSQMWSCRISCTGNFIHNF